MKYDSDYILIIYIEKDGILWKLNVFIIVAFSGCSGCWYAACLGTTALSSWLKHGTFMKIIQSVSLSKLTTFAGILHSPLCLSARKTMTTGSSMLLISNELFFSCCTNTFNYLLSIKIRLILCVHIFRLLGKVHDYNLDDVIKEIGYFRETTFYINKHCVDNMECPQTGLQKIATMVIVNY